MEIEKSDVNIGKLFNWGNKFQIYDKYKNLLTEVYIRLVGDAELNQARIKAIRASRELREKLKKEGTDERMAFIPDFSDMEKDDIINVILSLQIRRFMQEASKEVDIPLPAEPKSDAELDVLEAYQTEVDSYPMKVQEKTNEILMKKVDESKNLLDKENKEYLIKECEKLIIASQAEQEMLKKFSDWCTYFGTFVDENFKVRYFNSIEDFLTLPEEIKDQFVQNYQALDIGIDELKKSLEVTP